MNSELRIAPLETHDPESIRAFLESLGEVDRTFLHADALNPDVIGTWLRDAAATGERRYVAADDDGHIVGYLAVLPGHDWRAHVAEVRIVVHPSHRRRGIATHLARHAVVTAARAGITKLVVEVMSDEEATIAMFTALGFEAEGLLRDHVLGGGGETHDLLVLSHFVDQLYETMTVTGVPAALTE